MADIVGIKDEKKELIKENLKIKNQLQIVNSEYENIKRIYNNLLEEYLDSQFEQNFDKVLIIQDEVNVLKTSNLKLNEELRMLKDELGNLTLKEKEENYGQISVLSEENEKLKQDLNERELELVKLNLEIENFNEQQMSQKNLVDEISNTKEELITENESLKNQLEEIKEELIKNKIEFEKNSELLQEHLGKDNKISELNEFINELQSEFDKMENEKNESFQKEEKLNNQINEILKENKEHQEKYSTLEEEFERALENIEFSQNNVNALEEKIKEFDKNKKETDEYLEILQGDLQKITESLNESKEKEIKLVSQIFILENKKEETDDYVSAMEMELEKALDELKNMTEREESLNLRIYESEKNNELKKSEVEELRNQLQETQNVLNLKEENHNSMLDSVNKLNVKVEELENMVEEKEKEKEVIIENSNIKEEELNQLKNTMESHITAKNSELEQTVFLYEDSLDKLNDLEKEFSDLKELKEAIEVSNRELTEEHKKIEQNYIRTVHKNYDFRLMTSKMIGKFIEEQNVLKDAIKKSKLKEEFYKTENERILVSAEAELREKNIEEAKKEVKESKESISETTKSSLKNHETEHSFKHVLHKEHRVNIKNIFGDSAAVEETTDVLGSMICSLERRKEFHPYATEDVTKQDKIGEVTGAEESTRILEKEHKGEIKNIYAFENKNEMENKFETSLLEKSFEENDTLNRVNINSDKAEKRVFVKNKELFSEEKTEEFADFMKFMLPRTIENDAPLLEKDMFYFMVSFAFYNYNGEDFWDLLFDKLDISLNEREKYKIYLRKELDTIIKLHNFYQIKDEKGERVGASIVMHSILPVKQTDEFINLINDIYTFDLEGIVDKNTFPELLLNRLQEEKIYEIIKSVNYLKKSENLEKLLEYSYEMLKVMDWKLRGVENKRITLNNLVVEKINELCKKNSMGKKLRFSFDSFYGFGKK